MKGREALRIGELRNAGARDLSRAGIAEERYGVEGEAGKCKMQNLQCKRKNGVGRH